MVEINDVFPLNEFQRNADEHVERMTRSGKPQLLTVNGRAAVIVQDVASYQQMLDEMERLSALAGIRRGIEEVKRGETRPIEAVLEDLRIRYEQQAEE